MDWVQLVIFVAVMAFLAKPTGIYIFHVLNPEDKTFLDPVLKPIERFLYRSCRINTEEQNWKEYLISILVFSFVSVLFVMVILSLQYYLPLNPQKFSAPSFFLNLNTAVSFMTNTNWQNYSGETTMSYLSQMSALAVQNFVSAAVGLAAAATLVRGLARQGWKTIGNFWVDLVRITLYLLLPISIAGALLLMGSGVPQNFQSYVSVETVEGGSQLIAQGPVASQEAIKLLGSNGGGFMNANSAHPYENPSPFSNFLEWVLIMLIPVGQIYYFGKAVKETKHGWYILIALLVVFAAGVWCCAAVEQMGDPEIVKLGIAPGNFEGKEVRFGTFGSALFACITTAVSCGAVNCAHDSLTPIGGLIPMLNIQLDEVIFGGVGAGLYSVLIFVFLAIFIAGLIIGRTPEYLGKKINAFDIQMTMLAILPFVLVVHGCTALGCFTQWGLKAIGNGGPHGFSEILYAFSSTAANNGSAFAGLSSNTVFYNILLSLSMLLGRFSVLAPVIALAGSFVEKQYHPKTAASFPISSLIFTSLLVGVILLIGALTFLPALAMGPIIEHFFMVKGAVFP